jgi:hypothetical protein
MESSGVTGRTNAMAVEEEYLDVLQNIEFAIVSTYHDHPEMVDAHVVRALEAVIGSYRAEMAGRRPEEFSASPLEAELYEAIRDMCEWRLGRIREDEVEAGPPGPAPEPIKVDEIMLCLKRILKSVNRWNKSGGQRGYLTFIVQYVK